MEAEVSAYLADLEIRSAPSTLNDQRVALARLAKFFPEWEGLHRLDEQAVTAYLYRDGPKASTRAVEAARLHSFFEWCSEKGILVHPGVLRVPRPVYDPEPRRPVGSNDLAVALEHAPDTIAAMLYLAAGAGLWAHEIAGLHTRDVDYLHDSIRVNRRNGRPVPVPMSPTLRDALLGCDLPSRGWLFPMTMDPSRHLPAAGVSHKCNAYLRSVGVEATLDSFRGWHREHVVSTRDDQRVGV